MNIQRYDISQRQQLEQLLNNNTFTSIIQRSQSNRYEEQYDANYSASMLFTQSYLSLTTRTLSRVSLLFNSIINLLNNPRIVLSQQTFSQVLDVMNLLSTFLNQTANSMRNEFDARSNQFARRIRNSEASNEYLEQELPDHEEDIMWKAFEESIIDETRERDERMMENVMNQMNNQNDNDDGYVIMNQNGDIFILDEDMSLDSLSEMLDSL